MNARLLPLLFPLLLTTALIVAGIAYQDKLGTTHDSYARLQQALKGINPFLQKGSRIYVTDHTGEEFFHPQLPVFLPFNYIVRQDTVDKGSILGDSLLTIQKKQTSTIDTARLQVTHHIVWRRNEGGYVANLWFKRR